MDVSSVRVSELARALAGVPLISAEARRRQRQLVADLYELADMAEQDEWRRDDAIARQRRERRALYPLAVIGQGEYARVIYE